VAVLPVDLGAGERHEHRSPAAVADPALLAVEHPRPVRLPHRPRADVVGVAAGLGLGEREAGELAACRQLRQEALLLLVGPEQDDALHPDRLVHAHADRQRAVDLTDRLEDARVARLGQPLAAVLLRHVQTHEAEVAQVAVDLVGDPALVVDPSRVDALGRKRPEARDELADLDGLVVAGDRIGEDDVLVDLAQRERLGEAGDLRVRAGHDGQRTHCEAGRRKFGRRAAFQDACPASACPSSAS
jgi:hypothetical protein